MGLMHLWLGLLSMLVVVVVCFSGAMYSFKNQVSDLINKDAVFTSRVDGKWINAGDLEQKLQGEGKELLSIVVPENTKRTYFVTYSVGSKEVSSYVDPYTGKELGGPKDGGEKFFAWVLDLHRNLLMGETGRQINGIGILIFCFLLFSGIVLWFPIKRKHLKAALTIKWNAKFQRVNYDLHNTLGFYSCVLLFFIAVTGLYVTYPWMKNLLITSLGGDPIAVMASTQEKENGDDAFSALLSDMMERQDEKGAAAEEKKLATLGYILDASQKNLPYYGQVSIQFPTKDNPRFEVVKINTDNFLGLILPDKLSFDRLGELKLKERFSEKPLSEQFTALYKPLHTGEIFGLKGIILYFIITLIGFSLPITGFIFWWNRAKLL